MFALGVGRATVKKRGDGGNLFADVKATRPDKK
jgi:hypothetical protein